MKWTTSVGKLEDVAAECTRVVELSSTIGLPRLTHLYAVGDLLGPAQPLEQITVVMGVDVPVDDLPWWNPPKDVRHLLNLTRIPKDPVLVWWRSSRAPVGNHRITRPLLVWDVDGGARADAFAAIADGRGAEAGLPPASESELRLWVERDLEVSLSSLRACTQKYDQQRWGRAKLEAVADPLFAAANGYVDLLAAAAALDAGAVPVTGVSERPSSST